MRKVLAASLTLAAVVPATAAAQAPTVRHARSYERAYRRVAAQLGRRAPGRDIVRDGTAHGAATDGQVRASLAVLTRMLAAPASPASSSPGSSAGGGGSGGGVPACASESGSDYSTGPGNTNPSSRATGRYQILPSTAAFYGCDLGSPAGQDACAAVIYAHQGAGAWVGCGG